MSVQRTQTPNVGTGLSNDHSPRVYRFGSLGSTMQEARQAAAAQAPHGSVVVADQQTSGRGRSGRLWASPPGNLHATFILRPGGEPQHAPQLGFVTALAVARAVDGLAGPITMLKWPNDVMRGGAKLAGILLERTEDGTVLAGIGLNVRHQPPGMPYAVTSLAALGCMADRDAVLDAIRAALDAEWQIWRTQGFAAVRDRWRARGPASGTPMVARLDHGTIQGAFAGLREDGALLLQTAAGPRAIVAGEVWPCTTPPDMAKTNPC